MERLRVSIDGNFSFIPHKKSKTHFCEICKFFFTQETSEGAFLRFSAQDEIAVPVMINELCEPINTDGYTERDAKECTCDANVRENPDNIKMGGNIDIFPNFLIFKTEYTREIDASKDNILPLEFEGDKCGNYKLKGFILLENEQYYSVVLRHNKWMICSPEGIFNITDKIQDLLCKQVKYVFYDKSS